MDQVKKIMQMLLAQRFWILCGVVTLLPVGGWFTVTSDMRKLTEERKNAIKQKADQASQLNGKAANHPNEESHKAMDSLRNQVTNEVGAAWAKQYDRQKDLLVWPTSLGQDFVRVVDPLRPLETVKPPLTAQEEILSINLRERYRDYIADELPKLAKKIEADWLVGDSAAVSGSSGMAGADMAGMAGMPGMGATSGMAGMSGMPGMEGGGPQQQSNAKVLWAQQDQAALRSRYNWPTTPPRTIDVLYAQEDLWIMSALMDIIATTNQGSTGRYNAVVKEISYINLGQGVGGSTGSVMRLTAAQQGGTPGMEGMMGSAMPGMMGAEGSGMPGASGMPGMPGMAGMPGMSGMPGSEGSGTGQTVGPPDPAQYRYVDLDYKPVPADTLRTAITSESPDPSNAFLVVAKRIPVRMGLTVDQRRLNRLITACGNAPLMLEVRQVRFNKQGGSSQVGGGMSGGMGMGMGMESGMPGGFGGMGSGGTFGGMGMESGGMGMGMGMESGGMGMPGMGAVGSDTSPHDKPVEIYGVVYVYNPVDVKKLGIEKKEAEPETPPPAAPAAPAAAVPAEPVPAEPAAPAAAPQPAPPGAAAPGAGPAAGGVPPAGVAAPAAGAPAAGAPAAGAPAAGGAPPAGAAPGPAVPGPGA